jgi:signal transduction histidine kinase
MECPQSDAGAAPQRPSADVLLIASALKHGLRDPLAVLRASLEALARRPGDELDAAVVHAAIGQLAGLGRTVHDLLDFADPPPLRPVRCSVEEIVRGALEELRGDERTRVLLALEDSGDRLMVDGPRLSRCLGRLIEDGLSAGAECMLHTRRIDPGVEFTIVAEPRARRGGAPRDLCRAIAEREVRRMGGTIAFQSARKSTLVVGDAEAGVRREAAA